MDDNTRSALASLAGLLQYRDPVFPLHVDGLSPGERDTLALYAWETAVHELKTHGVGGVREALRAIEEKLGSHHDKADAYQLVSWAASAIRELFSAKGGEHSEARGGKVARTSTLRDSFSSKAVRDGRAETVELDGNSVTVVGRTGWVRSGKNYVLAYFENERNLTPMAFYPRFAPITFPVDLRTYGAEMEWKDVHAESEKRALNVRSEEAGGGQLVAEHAWLTFKSRVLQIVIDEHMVFGIVSTPEERFEEVAATTKLLAETLRTKDALHRHMADLLKNGEARTELDAYLRAERIIKQHKSDIDVPFRYESNGKKVSDDGVSTALRNRRRRLPSPVTVAEMKERGRDAFGAKD